jgi:hypothetical protein
MSGLELAKRLAADVDWTPVAGTSDSCVMKPKRPRGDSAVEEAELSEGDWDKFEADIRDAFDNLP